MTMLHEQRSFWYSAASSVPPKVRELFDFGCTAYACTSIRSLRAGARAVSGAWQSAACKAWRVSRNQRLLRWFPSLLPRLNPLSAADIVAADFSDFGNGFQVLLFAKQTRQGRALPLYFEVLRYPVREASQNLFVTAAIERFAATVGCEPILVFDRGFACPAIIHFLEAYQWRFVIRVKGGKHVQSRNGRMVAARTMERNDARVRVYGHTLRLITSDRKDRLAEPWYLVTNDTWSSREEIIDRYYHRFEIEEFFRDAKRLLGLEWITFKKAESLSVILWFVILGVWCLWHLAHLLTDAEEAERLTLRLSRVRYVFEKLQVRTLAPPSPPLRFAIPWSKYGLKYASKM